MDKTELPPVLVENESNLTPAINTPSDQTKGFDRETRELKAGFDRAAAVVNDIVLKKYLHELSGYDVEPISESLAKIEKLRLFKITEMVYQPKEFATDKFASVFSAVQNLDCGVFIVMDSDGAKTNFYMGIREYAPDRTASSLKNILEGSLRGQFPGIKTQELREEAISDLIAKMPSENVASVTCIARNKDEDFKDNETFLQGLEKFVMTMQGRKYTGIVLARNIGPDALETLRRSYEYIHTQLSPFADQQVSYGKNESRSFSEAFSNTVTGTTQKSRSTAISNQTSEGESSKDPFGRGLKAGGSLLLGTLSLATAPLTGGASLAAAGALLIGHMALNAYEPATKTTGASHGETKTAQISTSTSHAEGKTATNQSGSGNSETLQLTLKNRAIHDILEKIDAHLKRIDECEASGVWECASYFLSDSQETAEIAAGTYKALMMGQHSGIETSAINFWGRHAPGKRDAVRKYVTNFLHPILRYPLDFKNNPVTPASVVSSNELAIHMGLPRRSVCGLPVLEPASFGEEVVRPSRDGHERSFNLGSVFSMGRTTKIPVHLDIESLSMHTFVTGTTGSGKSNTIYAMLRKLRENGVRFLVIEPAKGEYKNVFGHLEEMQVYGTNPKKGPLLHLNPFSFPEDIHVLEHLDRLVELFNVCWPMYAAMPALLKSAMEKAYEESGWDLRSSENPRGRSFPNFKMLERKVYESIESSLYSADTKGDYKGALLTRVSSLTNGINGMIFSGAELEPSALFDRSAIIDLSRVGSSETKALIMGVLVMKLLEHRQTSGCSNSRLQHVTVLEEAHNILRNAAVQQNSEAGLLAKSVEMLANAIAEIRTYGEGFIIADQSPCLLDPSAIRNTNTKVILRLPDKNDRSMVGCAAGLNEGQIDELAKLQRGVAAVYQSDWAEPVLVQVDKCSLEEHPYSPSNGLGVLLCFLTGKLEEGKKYFSVEELQRHLDDVAMPTHCRKNVEACLREYRQTKRLTVWNDKKRLAALLTDMLGVKDDIEALLFSSRSFEELEDGLFRLARLAVPLSSEGIYKCLIRNFMDDACLNNSHETETRLAIHQHWFDHVSKGKSYDKKS